MKLLMENWKKYLTEAEEINENDSEDSAKELYAQYWWHALKTIDSYAEEDDDDLAPGKAIAGTIEAEQVSYALSYLKDLLVLNENPSEEEIKKAILDGWEEGEREFNDDYWVEKNLELGASETPDAEPVYKHADASVYDNIEF